MTQRARKENKMLQTTADEQKRKKYMKYFFKEKCCAHHTLPHYILLEVNRAFRMQRKPNMRFSIAMAKTRCVMNFFLENLYQTRL